jgi:hypothetical protein
LLDAVQLALAQLGTAAGQADAVAAGVGEEERAVLVGDLGVMAGQVTLVVLDAPVAILGPADLATGAAKVLFGESVRPCWRLSSSSKTSSMVRAPCAQLSRLRAWGSPRGR